MNVSRYANIATIGQISLSNALDEHQSNFFLSIFLNIPNVILKRHLTSSCNISTADKIN